MSMEKIDKKLEWLNIHCNNRFFITVTEATHNYNIRDKKQELEFTNLNLYMLNKELDNLEWLSSQE